MCDCWDGDTDTREFEIDDLERLISSIMAEVHSASFRLERGDTAGAQAALKNAESIYARERMQEEE